jgi:hypothetical protein
MATAIQILFARSPLNLALNRELLFLRGAMWLVLPLLNNWQSSTLLAQGSINGKGF